MKMEITELAKERLQGRALTEYALAVGKSVYTIRRWKMYNPHKFYEQHLYIKELVKVTGLKKEEIFK